MQKGPFCRIIGPFSSVSGSERLHELHKFRLEISRGEDSVPALYNGLRLHSGPQKKASTPSCQFQPHICNFSLTLILLKSFGRHYLTQLKTKESHHRIIECIGLERTLEITYFQPLCHRWGCHTVDQVAHGLVQPGSKGWGIHNLSGQPEGNSSPPHERSISSKPLT